MAGLASRKPSYQGEITTRLERFIRARELFPSHISKACGLARNRLLLYRTDGASPTLPIIRRLVRGLRKLTKDPTICANDLFPLDDDDD